MKDVNAIIVKEVDNANKQRLSGVYRAVQTTSLLPNSLCLLRLIINWLRVEKKMVKKLSGTITHKMLQDRPRTHRPRKKSNGRIRC